MAMLHGRQRFPRVVSKIALQIVRQIGLLDTIVKGVIDDMMVVGR